MATPLKVKGKYDIQRNSDDTIKQYYLVNSYSFFFFFFLSPKRTNN